MGAPVEGRGVGEAAVEHAVDGGARLVLAAAPGVHCHGELRPPLHTHLPAGPTSRHLCDGGMYSSTLVGGI